MATTGQVVFSGVNGQGNVSIFQSPIRSWELPLTGGAWPTAGYRITHVQWAVGNVLMNQPKRECHVVLAGDAGKEIDAFKPYLLAYAAGSYYSLSRPGAALESELKGKSSISLGFYSTKGDLSENTGNVFSIRGGCALSLTVTYELLFQASPFSLDKSAMDMGRTVTVSVGATDVNGGFTHTATLSLGGQSVTASRTGPGAIRLTVPASWYGLLPTSVSGTATVTVTTAGAGQTGSASKPLTLTIPASVKPTAGTLTAEGISPYWGLYVQGISRARLTLSGYAAGAGASGVSVSIAGGGYSGTGASLTTGALKTAGAVTFTATVMDSRGRTATATVSLTVTAYNPPKITSLGVARCTADGTVDEAAGTYVKITLGYTWSAIGSNAIDGDIYIGGVKTQSNAALPASGEAFAAAFGGELAIAAAYPIKVMIYDGIHTRSSGAGISAEAILQSVKRVLNFYPSADSGIGVGKMATGEKRVDIGNGWKYCVDGVDLFLKIYPVGAIYLSTSPANPGELFGGVWEAWGQGRVPVGMGSNGTTNYTAVNATGGAEAAGHAHTVNDHNHWVNGHVLTVNEMPRHNHGFAGGNNLAILDTAWGAGYYTNLRKDGNKGFAVQQTPVDNAGGSWGHDHGWTGGANNLGTGWASVDLRQPYITCYMWRRTA